jgi:hypothetical protein
VLLVDDQQPAGEPRRRVPTTRSQIAFAFGACGGLAAILVPSAGEHGIERAGELARPALIRNLEVRPRQRAGPGPSAGCRLPESPTRRPGWR